MRWRNLKPGLLPILGPDFLGISLQFYLGNQFSVYNDPFFIENVAPGYRSRRFSKEYIIGDAMQLVVNDIFPDKSGSKPLIEQMVEKGKRWYLLDKFLPSAADSVKTGYTQQQLDWCTENEGLIWSYIVKMKICNHLTRLLYKPILANHLSRRVFRRNYHQAIWGSGLGGKS